MSGQGQQPRAGCSSSSSSGNSTAASSQNRLSPTVWIGNISSRASEYQVLKLVEKIGKVERFDFMYHGGSGLSTSSSSSAQSGSNSSSSSSSSRTPRGYAFVTYSNYAVADEAIRKLHGQVLCGRPVSVQPSRAPNKGFGGGGSDHPRSLAINMKGGSTTTTKKMSTEDKIKAMEMKLKALEGSGGLDFKVVVPSAATTTTSSTSYASTSSSSQHKRLTSSTKNHTAKPYERLKR